MEFVDVADLSAFVSTVQQEKSGHVTIAHTAPLKTQ